MPKTRTVQNTFTSGELDPILHERYDHDLYGAGLSLFQNWILKPHGAAVRRPGTRYVANTRNDSSTRLIPFIFNVSQGVILEFGDLYIRFFTNNGLVSDGGGPLNIVSPYTSDQIADIQYTQSGDIMILTHPDMPPYEFARLGALEWRIQEIEFIPPPTSETGYFHNDSLVLSDVSGNITITSPSAIFLSSDDNRLIAQIPTIGNGKAIITTVTSSTVVSATVINMFSDTALVADEWKLSGSPVAALAVSNANPVGALTTLTLQRLHAGSGNPDLVLNGVFTTLASWTDASGGVVTSGSGDAGGSDLLLFDAAGTFLTSGVRIGHRALNTSSSTEDEVLGVRSNVLLDVSANGAAHGAGLNYSIQRTGTVTAMSPSVNLDGGRQGMAWIHQSITVVDGVTYRLVFDVSNQPVSMMVSTVAGRGDIVEEFSYAVKNDNEVIFTAEGTTAIIEFRNNQAQIGTVNNVGLRVYDISGFRAVDVGKFIKINGGVVEIIEYINATQVKGVIRRGLSDIITASKGAWSIEEPMWSQDNGYPKAACFYGSHLFFAGTSAYPTRVWANRLLSLYDFSEGTSDDDGFQFQIAATEINAIEWLIGERVLLVGTQREEFTVRGSVGQTITPTSIEPASPSKFGSANMQPIRAQRAVLFVQRGRKRLRELTSSDDGGAEDRKNSDRTLYVEHLFKTDSIKKIVYQQEPTSILWALTDSGQLFGMSYLLDQLVFGWCRYPTDGDIIDIAVIPHQDGDRDQLWMIVDRDTGFLFVEYLDDAGGFYGQLMVDSGVTGSFSPATTTISGLDHLEGELVTVVTNGYPHPSQTVVSGDITLDWAATEVEVGLPFTPKLTTLRPVLGGEKRSTALTGLQLSNSRTTLSLMNTINLLVNDQRLTFTTAVGLMDTAPPLFTGIKEIELMGWDREGIITIEQDLPYPVTVRGIMRTLSIEEP